MKKCDFCSSKNNVRLIYGKYFCKKCYIKAYFAETSLISELEWQQAVKYRNFFEENIDILINNLVSDLSSNSLDLKQKQERVLKFLENEIALRLQYYNKDELFIAFLTIRELIKRKLITQKESTDWVIISDISVINLLMRITNQIDAFEKNSMGNYENHCSNFANAICLARRYVTIINNIALTVKKNVALNGILFEPIQTNETEEYFSRYLKNGINEKPEDYTIENKTLLQKLENEGKTPDKIINGLNDLLIKEFGFIRKDYQLLSTSIFRMEFPSENEFWDFVNCKRNLYEQFPIIIIEKKWLEENIGKVCMEAILNTFSINRNIDKHKIDDELELFCFYEVNQLVIFGNFDFSQTISAFEKFLVSGDYIDIYKDGISKNKLFSKAQRNLSKFFSASVSDYLFTNGYKLPMEKYMNVEIPRSEIDKIYVNGKNILINKEKLGDIDVLALDIEKKEVLLFELKFYKPAMSSNEMLYKDKSKIIDKEIVRHIKAREVAISHNIDEVVKYILGEYQYGYKVRSILLTARTNYYAIQEKEIEYLTWSEFFEQVIKKQL